MALDVSAIKTAAKILIEAQFDTDFDVNPPPSTNAAIRAAVARVIAEVVDEFADAIDTEISGSGAPVGTRTIAAQTFTTTTATIEYNNFDTPTDGVVTRYDIVITAFDTSVGISGSCSACFEQLLLVRRNGATCTVVGGSALLKNNKTELSPSAAAPAWSFTGTTLRVGLTRNTANTVRWYVECFCTEVAAS